MGPIVGLRELISLLLRHAPLIAFILVAGVLATLSYALSLPRTYETTTVIQVQPSLLSGTEDGAAQSETTGRLRLIEQRLMARENVLRLIKEYNLYADTPLSATDQLAQFRRDTKIDLIPSVGGNAGAGSGVSALIISARSGDPGTAARLADDLAEQIIAGNRSAYVKRLRDLVSALRDEDDRLVTRISDLQADAEDFRSKNADALPENMPLLSTERTRLQDQQFDLIRTMQDLDRERLALEVGDEDTDGDRPDSITDQLGRLEVSLAQARRTLGNDHPEVQRLQDSIASLRAGEESAPAPGLLRQMELIDNQRRTLAEQREKIQTRLPEIASAIAAAPEVADRLVDIERQRRRLEVERDSIAGRLSRAQLDERLAANEYGERMIVLEAAAVPAYPLSAGRKKIAVLGLAMSIAVAVMTAFAIELTRPVMRTARQVEHQLGVAPIAIARHRYGMFQSPANRRRLTISAGIMGFGILIAAMIITAGAG